MDHQLQQLLDFCLKAQGLLFGYGHFFLGGELKGQKFFMKLGMENDISRPASDFPLHPAQHALIGHAGNIDAHAGRRERVREAELNYLPGCTATVSAMSIGTNRQHFSGPSIISALAMQKSEGMSLGTMGSERSANGESAHRFRVKSCA
jgi:hypothetical protein